MSLDTLKVRHICAFGLLCFPLVAFSVLVQNLLPYLVSFCPEKSVFEQRHKREAFNERRP